MNKTIVFIGHGTRIPSNGLYSAAYKGLRISTSRLARLSSGVLSIQSGRDVQGAVAREPMRGVIRCRLPLDVMIVTKIASPEIIMVMTAM